MLHRVSLPDQERANLLHQWAQLESAGTPAAHTAAALANGASERYRPALERFRKRLSAGSAPASVAQSEGLLQEWEAKVVDAAYQAGRLEAGLRLLANECEAKAARWRRFKSRLALPLFILVAATFLAPLPGLVAGTLSIGSYLLKVISLPALLVGSIVVVRAWLNRRNLVSSGFNRIILKIPVVGRMIDLRAKRDYIVVLAILLRSGIPAFDALPLARSAVGNRTAANSFSVAEDLVRSGKSIADALQRSGVLDSPTGYAFATTGEFSGHLDDMLERYGRLLEEQVTRYADQVADWAPRIIYLGIAGWLAIQIIGFWSGYFPVAGGSQ